MRIVSYLSLLLLPRLLDAIRDIGADYVQGTNWDDVEAALHDSPDGILVADPHTDGTDRTNDVAAFMTRRRTVPVLVYTEFTPAALKALTTLSPLGVYESFLFQIDDTRPRFSRLLIRASTHCLVIRLLDTLRPKCQRLPAPLGNAVEDLFRRPHAYTSGQDLVLAGRTPHTSLQRALAQVGLAPPKQLFIAARVLHAVGYLRNPEYTVEQVAAQTGYQYARVLTQHTLAVFGVRPSQLRALSNETALERLLVWSQLE